MREQFERVWNEFEKTAQYIDLDKKGIPLKTIAIDFALYASERIGVLTPTK